MHQARNREQGSVCEGASPGVFLAGNRSSSASLAVRGDDGQHLGQDNQRGQDSSANRLR